MDRTDKLAEDLRKEVKEINIMLTDIKVSLEHFKTNLDNLNEYTHSRIHYLTNTDTGLEKMLNRINERLGVVETKQENLESFKKRVEDTATSFFARIIQVIIMVLIGGVGGALVEKIFK